MENCGRVHYGKDMDDQRKGASSTVQYKFLPISAFCFNMSQPLKHYNHQNQNLFSGIVGDILLNHTPLRDFTIYGLDMTPGFIDR